MSLTLHLQAADGALHDLVVPDPAWPGSSVRPSGPGYVRYEDLYRAGDTVSQAVNRLTVPAVITFPEGLFEWADFKGAPGVPTAPYGVYLPHICLGIVGSGPGVAGSVASGTVFRGKAQSSTVARIPQDNKTPNAACMIYHGTGTTKGVAYSYGQFQLVGTDQPHPYHGLTVHNPAGPVRVFDVIGFGGSRADNGAPPGECFTIGISGSNGPHLIERCDVDGNNVGGGITVESAWKPLIRNCTSKNTITAPFVYYQAFGDGTTPNSVDCVAGPCPYRSGPLSGTTQSPPVANPANPNWNHEQTAGLVHLRFTQVGVTVGQGVNLTHSNGNWQSTIDGHACSTVDGSLTLIDPVMAPTQGLIEIQSWTSEPGGDTQKTPPVLRRSDGTRIPYKWNHGGVVTLVQ